MAKRNVPTLVLVHRQPLLEQWKSRIASFLGVDAKHIGVMTGTRKKRTGRIDLAMLQSLVKSQELESMVRNYGQVIVDECHHIPAASFESVIKQFSARFVLGLTATPYRKDGLEKILFQQCGPIRHEMVSSDGAQLTKEVIVRETGFRMPLEAGPKPPYYIFAQLLTTHARRNSLIVADVMNALKQGRLPLILSDRKDHLSRLAAAVDETAKLDQAFEDLAIFHMDGAMGLKARREMLATIRSRVATGRQTLILSTASLIGEGFDLPELDVLVMASPFSFKGRIVQYAGRIHRAAGGKSQATIHDYVEAYCQTSLKMYRNRIKAYREMSYAITELDSRSPAAAKSSTTLPCNS